MSSETPIIGKFQMKQPVIKKRKPAVINGPTIHSAGMPSKLHSGLATHGHVTKGMVTGN